MALINYLRRFSHIACALALASISLSASATLYKCKQADGSYVYQDTQCKLASEQQILKINESTSNDYGLVPTLSEVLAIGAHSAARKAIASGKTQSVDTCILSLDRSKFIAMAERIVAKKLTPSEAQIANTFFNTESGSKFAKKILATAYQAYGEKNPDASPLTFTDADNIEGNKFNATSAGKKLNDRQLWAPNSLQPEIVAMAQEFQQYCGTKH